MQALAAEVAIVDQTSGLLDPADVDAVARAVNAQVQDDFRPVWHVNATVTATVRPGARQWQVKLLRSLDVANALGYHADDAGVPFAVVDVEDAGEWSVTVSHEVLEMLADPFGWRTHSGRVPQGMSFRDVGLPRASSQVHYLLEVCDPPEAEQYGYESAGVQVSDFIRPAWYRATPMRSGDYDFVGIARSPRVILPGGYVTFSVGWNDWWQAFADAGGELELSHVGAFSRAEHSSLRAFADDHARRHRGP